MPLPAWMKNHPGAPQPEPTHPAWMAGHLDGSADTDEQAGIRPCSCRGEGCDACDGDGVIYP
ncbi:hypothetical protein [Streptomyces europaeiscabiei]|uniref:hypothetical protein n=1 Tax=Streptomyces europaeiscabiei TaxID=146819 RepID=UPI0029A79BF7|nr:hypothetical protein [Streptomyces europaeiscabiei]MDX2757866.1 hypothetical protein [Streptomyces europaeiscabiei]